MKRVISVQEKMSAIGSYQNGSHSLRELGAMHHVHHSSIEKWIVLYESFGVEGLERSGSNMKYPRELKDEAVKVYLGGGRTLYEVCKKYKIRSLSLLQNWILQHQKEEKTNQKRNITNVK